jgi:hypothetical protein
MDISFFYFGNYTQKELFGVKFDLNEAMGDSFSSSSRFFDFGIWA